MSISAILMAIALPQMSDLKASYNQLNAKSYFVQDLKRAQAEAITQGCRGIIKIAANMRSYYFGCDYLSYDVDPNPSPDMQRFKRNLPPQITLSSDAPIIFNSRGQAVDIDYIISNLTVTFTETNGQGVNQFATGTLLGTGVFSFN